MAYEISIDRVVEMFNELAGETSPESSGLFCKTAAHTVSGWLDNEKELSSNDGIICYAAATIAFYRYTLKSVGTSVDFKAGDITVKEDSSLTVKFAEILMNDAHRDLEPLCRNRRFSFMKV